MTFINIKNRPSPELITKYDLQEITGNDKTDFKLYVRSLKGSLAEDFFLDYPDVKNVDKFFDLRAIKLSFSH